MRLRIRMRGERPMKNRYQILLAILSGILVCVSFPTLIGVRFPELGWLGWVALVPLFVAIRQSSPRRAFLIALISAAIWFFGSIFWVYRAMHTFGHLPGLTSFLVLVLLVAIVSVYLALAPMLARMIELRWRGEFIVLMPVVWTAIEILRNYFPCNGFPWSNVAMSQWRILPAIQIADLVGVYGVTFLLVWVNACLAEVVLRLRGERVPHLAGKIAVTAVLVATTFGYGFFRLHTIPEELSSSPSMTLGLVQGNIAQEEKWSKSAAQKNLDVHREGARRLAESDVEMIVWPEASFPWPIKTTDTSIDPRALGLNAGGVGGGRFRSPS